MIRLQITDTYSQQRGGKPQKSVYILCPPPSLETFLSWEKVWLVTSRDKLVTNTNYFIKCKLISY